MAKAALEPGESYMKSIRKNIVIVLEDLNFTWDESELLKMADMWKDGYSIDHMAFHFKRESDEILIALLHLSRSRKISKRKGGIFGCICRMDMRKATLSQLQYIAKYTELRDAALKELRRRATVGNGCNQTEEKA